MSGPPRRVIIKPDTCSTLFMIRCETPCGPDGRCRLRGDHGYQKPLPREQQGICYLGSGATWEGAAERARSWGYEVVEVNSMAAATPVGGSSGSGSSKTGSGS